jgi:hypothetical protein
MSIKRLMLPAVLLSAITPAYAQIPADVEQYLLRTAGFARPDLNALESGTVIARVMEGTTDTEVMVVAAVRIRATRERVLSYYGQMVAYVDGKITTGFGRFGNPPTLADVKSLSLNADDLAQLRSCKPGDCDLRIGGTALNTIRPSIDWKAPDAAAQANARVREAIVNYMAAYMKSGDEALVTYTDREQPVSLRQQWREIVAASPYFQQYSAPLRDYLTTYPRQTLPGARDVLYWVQEDYTGLKPVLSLVHGVIHEDPARPDRTVVVQKQLYASHYYDGSLAVAVVIGGAPGPAPVSYLVYANRSRGDLLKGGFGGLRRTAARNQAKSAAEQTLGTIKTVLEGGREADRMR